MAKKSKTVYVCRDCGYQSSRWLGKCPNCSGWDTLEEIILADTGQQNHSSGAPPAELLSLVSDQPVPVERILTGFGDVDLVLGGGIVPGSLIMIGGDPGIGKSTLMLQLIDRIQSDQNLIYISGEESFAQIKQRAARLGIKGEHLLFSNETNLEAIEATLRNTKSDVVVIDSIQTIYSENIDGIMGNVSQLRYCGSRFLSLAKELNITIFLIGHVTKEGNLAGPKILEHMVDTVLYFEGDSNGEYRILRSIKNRFGAVNELAIFEMASDGLHPVLNPSALFLSAGNHLYPGSSVVSIIHGRRPLLVEVQALVAKTQFGVPQRTATGIDHRRMNLLLAVLEKKCAKPFGFHDVFLKTAGGLPVHEPAADLGICMALVSSLEEQPFSGKSVFIGEVGLSGELRPVRYMQERVNEAEKLGFKKIILPENKQKISAQKAELLQFASLQDILTSMGKNTRKNKQ